MEKSLSLLRHKKIASKPLLLDLSLPKDRDRFETLVVEGEVRQISDDFEEEQRELFGIRNPSRVYAPGFEEEFKKYYKSLSQEKPLWEHGRWAYFSWRYLAAHILPEEEYRLVRTARNQNLITKEEQEKFYNATIGIAGLSVGSSVAFAIALGGGGKRMKLADMDRLALSNTNRILAGADRLGMLKVEMAARTIYEINPYAELELHPEGLTSENIEAFFEGLDIVVDEIDNLAVKYLIREQAKKRKIAVVMAADNGDNAVVDVERYDLDPQPEFFHGRMGEVSYEMLKGLDKFGIGKMITKHVGPENVTERMQQSLTEMGKTIVSWPQLGGAAMVNGAAVAYCVRKILNRQPLESNRALVSLDEKLVPDYHAPEAVAHRQQISADFARGFGL
ncbi:ThiF family adenylyltransferase [Candidatus Kaiserbacteria bacterium]|nr:ThiF family adenylyltransferase [Candidatus Kaiserbacteria bacterium]